MSDATATVRLARNTRVAVAGHGAWLPGGNAGAFTCGSRQFGTVVAWRDRGTALRETERQG